MSPSFAVGITSDTVYSVVFTSIKTLNWCTLWQVCRSSSEGQRLDDMLSIGLESCNIDTRCPQVKATKLI
jgi:hypothetical protein